MLTPTTFLKRTTMSMIIAIMNIVTITAMTTPATATQGITTTATKTCMESSFTSSPTL